MRGFLYGALATVVFLVTAVGWLWLSKPEFLAQIAQGAIAGSVAEDVTNSKKSDAGGRKIDVSFGKTKYNGECYWSLDFNNRTKYDFSYAGSLYYKDTFTGSVTGTYEAVFRIMNLDFSLPAKNRKSKLLKYEEAKNKEILLQNEETRNKEMWNCDKDVSIIEVSTLRCELENHNALECMNSINWGSVRHSGQ
jgi:hypothetical protein